MFLHSDSEYTIHCRKNKNETTRRYFSLIWHYVINGEVPVRAVKAYKICTIKECGDEFLILGKRWS